MGGGARAPCAPLLAAPLGVVARSQDSRGPGPARQRNLGTVGTVTPATTATTARYKLAMTTAR